MSLISEQQIETIRSRADIVQIVGERVALKRSGRNFKGLCPFHQERTSSFMVHPEKQIFHCFGCGVGGDVFSFLMKLDGLDFNEVIKELADRYDIVLQTDKRSFKSGVQKEEKELFFRVNRFALRFFYDSLLKSESGAFALRYLEQRGIRREMIQESLLGYAPSPGKTLTRRLEEKKVPLDFAQRAGLVKRGTGGDYYDFFRNRLIFPIINAQGKVLGFSGRALEDDIQPKYLNTAESPIYKKSETLLGFHLALPFIREKNEVILVEGNFDLLRLQQEGIRHAVAPLGTALTEQQVLTLRRFTENFILIFDGDAAGQKASERALEIFLPLGLIPRVVILPQGEDPDSFVLKEGKDRLQALILAAPPLMDRCIELIFKRAGRDSQGKLQATKKIAELLSKLPGEIEKTFYIQKVNDNWGISEDILKKALKTSRPGKNAQKMESNFSTASGDEKVSSFPTLERTILEVLLSGQVDPAILLDEIEIADFSHPLLGKVWSLLQESYKEDGSLEVAPLLMKVTDEKMKKLLSELIFSAGRWEGEGKKIVGDCLQQLKKGRLREKLKDLSEEIRQAERERNLLRMEELLGQKNQLLKQISVLRFH